MEKPVILAVDDDLHVLKSIQRDLRKEFRKDYKIVATHSANEALSAIREMAKKGDNVALLISDQRMPEMGGVDYLEQARNLLPEAKRVLLTAYSDTDAAIKAINDVQLDYYLMKPWDPPEERMYPVLHDLLNDWHAAFRPEFAGIRVVGYQWSPRSHAIKDFLAGNMIPYRWLDVETSEEAARLLEASGTDRADLPAVYLEDGEVLAAPGAEELADKLGMTAQTGDTMYDVVIIGAGPAGLAGAVYGASEGLNTLLVERRAPGGQAGTSSRIENYLGFPSGLSGSQLAQRAITQASRLGAHFLLPRQVKGIRLQDGYKSIVLSDDSEIHSRAVIITTGVDYRRLDTEGLEQFTGAGVYYGAATTEAAACRNEDVYIVGGGNSAGQAAMYLSKFAANVYIVIRRDSLRHSMSHYLIEQIDKTANIHLLPFTEVKAARGENRLAELDLQDNRTQEVRTAPAASLFIFIGAKPYTEWLGDDIIKNKRGFIETGRDLANYPEFKMVWKLEREPFLLETSVPGILAAGDVRAGAMNRVASAVGEGSMAIKFVHEYLAQS